MWIKSSVCSSYSPSIILIVEMSSSFSSASTKSTQPTVVYVKPLPQGLEWNSTYQTYTAPAAKLQTAKVSSSRVPQVPWNPNKGF
jgi:hypothetical protein